MRQALDEIGADAGGTRVALVNLTHRHEPEPLMSTTLAEARPRVHRLRPPRGRRPPAQPGAQGADQEAGRFGFRGELALRFATKMADEARPPELTCDQVIAVAQAGNPKLPFFAGYLLSFEHLKDVADTLGDTLSAGGKYFLFCNNIDLSKKYQVRSTARCSTCCRSTSPRSTTSCWNCCTSRRPS
jgi:hypothetical protein